MRNKGKVYPTPSSSSSSSSASPLPASSGDSFSVFKLLPAAILALAVTLSLEEREVLAYMITRSIKITNSTVRNKKKPLNNHKPPVFDCECFVCYTSYWFKWDSSPNRELIHKAIEAFEDHLNNGEDSRKKGKKRVKVGHHRLVGKSVIPPAEVQDAQSPPVFEAPTLQAKEDPDQISDNGEEEESQPPGDAAVTVSQEKGWARTVLPDVLGLLNSRLWSLWSPNV
ncbi:hypothetical protein L2E82_13325 [Cichorium intybus]|uniref:Uncharacterized protein n=1 Tax=Cichorium intybus TaxID=13427 RepID=A0ACB9EY02_CICIN|nr:hypothetical protein L2E82_13325 [Cichorium intybus]